jgi:hypothetical protein
MPAYDPNAVFTTIAQRVNDNTTGDITPADMRLVLGEVVNDARQQVATAPGPGPNALRGVDKRVRFETVAQLRAAPDGGDCLAELANETLVLGGLAQVEFMADGRHGVDLRLVWDGEPRTPALSGLRAYRTGHCVPGDVVPVKWVERDSPAALVVNIPAYSPTFNATGTPPGYPVGYTVTYTLQGEEGFYQALASGPLPAPTSRIGDANWRRIAPPMPPTALFQRLSQSLAVAMDGDEAVAPGRHYAVELGQGRYVELTGGQDRRFPGWGLCAGEPVLVNVHNGYVEVTGPEQVAYADLLARFADTPPIAGKLYGITARPSGGAAVLGRFDDVTAWVPGGVAPGMLVATGARVVGQAGTVSFDLKANTATTSGGGPDPDALPAPLVSGVRTVTAAFTLDTSPRLANARGFSGPNTGPEDRNYWEGNWELRAYNGADANYFAFVQSSKYAAMRRDAVDARIAAALDALPAYVEVGIDFPSAGAQSREVRINQKRLVGSVSVVSTTSAMTNLSFKKNGAVVALPVAVALGDVLTVSASMPTGGGVIVLNVS